MKNSLVITALQDTYLKKKPVPEGDLSDNQKVFVKQGQKYRIVWKSTKKDGHLRVSLSDFAGNWYIFFNHWEGCQSIPIAASPCRGPEQVQIFKTEVQAINLSQPDAVTCQSACIGMAVGDKDIRGIRSKLKAIGDAGSPAVMGRVIRSYGVKYEFDDNASLSEIRERLKRGVFCITHGWFTNSGHVICLDGLKEDSKSLSYAFDVKDPWSEFDGPSWSYNNPSVKFYDGYYSSHIIYASCVKSVSVAHAQHIYNKKELDSSLKGAWAHYITP